MPFSLRFCKWRRIIVSVHQFQLISIESEIIMFRKHWFFAGCFTALTLLSISLFHLRDSSRAVLGAVLSKNREIADLKAEIARFTESVPSGLSNQVFPHEGGDVSLLYSRASEVVSFRDLPKREGDDAYYSVLLIRNMDGSELHVVMKSSPSLVTEWLKDKLPWR